MFKWLKEIDEPPFRLNYDNGELNIKRLDSTVELNEMSHVCQFFASSDLIIGEDCLTILPTPNDNALEIIRNEIVPHYLDVKQIFIDGELKEINVRRLKKESKRIVQDLLSNCIYPVITDLYRAKNLNLATQPREIKYYLVKLELIEPIYIQGTEMIRKFLMHSYFAESGSIGLQPTGWKLDDRLKESVTIRAFSTFAKQIVLVVDNKDMSIVGLDIYG
jgi:hypothetical protein